MSKLSKAEKLELAKKIIARLEKNGVDVDERVSNEEWMLEENSFFGCEGSSYVGIDDLFELVEMYELKIKATEKELEFLGISEEDFKNFDN